MLEEKNWAIAQTVGGYPGLAYAKALALRAQEDAEKNKVCAGRASGVIG